MQILLLLGHSLCQLCGGNTQELPAKCSLVRFLRALWDWNTAEIICSNHSGQVSSWGGPGSALILTGATFFTPMYQAPWKHTFRAASNRAASPRKGCLLLFLFFSVLFSQHKVTTTSPEHCTLKHLHHPGRQLHVLELLGSPVWPPDIDLYLTARLPRALDFKSCTIHLY